MLKLYFIYLWTYLLDPVLVSLLERHDFIGALLRVLNLLPRLHLLLLEQGDTIGQQLCVSLDTIYGQASNW